MALGEKLRQARQAAGLSQRALCGSVITRNMLSQIENGTATPSMATLQYLAGRLGKPVSFFLEETPAQAVTPLARAAEGLEQVRQLLEAGKGAVASELLAGLALPEGVPWLTRQAILLRARLDPDAAVAQVPMLPALDDELLLRARAALEGSDAVRCTAYLQATDARPPLWHLLMGEALLQQARYDQAAPCFHQAEQSYPHRTSQALEICYRELEDYQKAYFYACRVRNLSGK